MRRLRYTVAVVVFSLVLGVSCLAQNFATIDERTFDTSRLTPGTIYIMHGNIYRKHARTGLLSKFLLTGQEVFGQLPPPSVGRAIGAISVTEDLSGNIYVSDGMNIHAYSPGGQYKGSISPGINMAMNGLVALDGTHFYVTGRIPPSRGGGSTTIFEITQDGVRQSFGTVPFPSLAGTEDAILNTDNMLAFDKSRELLYELSQYLYEIRVYNLKGEHVRTITPPAAYRLRPPNVKKVKFQKLGRGAGVEPSDTLTDLFVFPDGGVAVEGMLLRRVTANDNHQQAEYSTFIDIYDGRGQFMGRLDQDKLKAAGSAWYASVDRVTGDFYFADTSKLYRARPSFAVTARK